jgi:hypothetical protein
MIELLERTTQDSDTEGITQTNTMTLVEKYSVRPVEIERQIGEIVMATQTKTHVTNAQSDSDVDHTDY